jgi:EAL domain-containing protein (putative c-di-GMP-specific phosphodiesterase class I)
VEAVGAARTGSETTRLHLELTEGVLIQSAAAREVVRACKQLGAGLFLDDFGTGYSSLAYLNQLPFDALKIDHSFARKLEEAGDGHKLILAIVGLATTLGRGVVMEGIETAAQRDIYRAMGGRLGQGYLFARPAPLPAMRELLVNSRRLPWG